MKKARAMSLSSPWDSVSSTFHLLFIKTTQQVDTFHQSAPEEKKDTTQTQGKAFTKRTPGIPGAFFIFLQNERDFSFSTFSLPHNK